MIRKPDVFPLLLVACPSFHAVWEDERAYWDDDIAGGHVSIMVFSAHLLDLFLAGRTQCFPAVFAVVERMIVEGDCDVQDLATAGLLEDLQNQALNKGLDWNETRGWIGTHSFRGWARNRGESGSTLRRAGTNCSTRFGARGMWVRRYCPVFHRQLCSGTAPRR